MYGARPFHEQEHPELIKQVMRSYPFATLIVTKNNMPMVTHLPLLYDEEHNVIRGHIARDNPVASLDSNEPVSCMVLFQGPDAYVSAAWYPAKEETGRVVPTWNYVAVHVTGPLRIGKHI
ncbi:FMN-binding negative transcriptional regulator [archaeon]|nr:MAG: FMN-binding negative transcriptional regulator [archaeon]